MSTELETLRAENEKLKKEAQFLRSQHARAEMERFIIADLLDDAYEGLDSDYETALTDRIDKTLKALREACENALDSSVDARPYPDGPCLPKDVREQLRAALRA